jgi:tight adherence protein B
MFVLGALTGGVVLGVVAGGGVAVAALLARALVRGRQDRLLVAGLPAALDAVARTAAAGAPLLTGLREAARMSSGHLASDLAAVVTRTELGEPLRAGLDRWARLRPLPEVRIVASALLLASGSGGSIAAAAQRLSMTLRERGESRRLVVAQAAQARASATVVGLAPVAVVGAMTMADSAAADVLFGTSLGLVCLVLGLGMDALAVWWMASMIRSAE